MGKKKNPLVFLDVCIDGDPLERMVFELFSDVAPRTAENFRALCTGEKGVGPRLGKPLHYKGTFFHYILKGSMAQGGDLLRQEGSSGESIYGDKFPDEPPKLKHDESGLLSMSIADRSTRGSIFNLLFKANQNLDRKHVVFGKLVLGSEVLKKIESAGNEDGVPDVTVKIVNCGELTENDKKRLGKKLGKQASLDAIGQETRRKVIHKKTSRDKRKKRRYYLSESESSSDGELSSTESDSDSETESESETDTSSSDISSSSDDRRKKRKRSRRDKHGRGKRRERHREKKWKRHGKHSRRKSKRALDSSSEVDSGSGSESSSGDQTKAKDLNQKHDLQITAGNHILPQENMETIKNHKTNISSERCDEKRFPKENGEHRVNGCERDVRSRSEDRQPDVVEDHPDKSRSRSPSPKRSMSKSMSISPRNRSIGRSVSRSPNANKSPPRAVLTGRSLSRSPMRSVSKSPARSLSRSPSRSISRSPPRNHAPRKVSVSPIRPQLRRSPSGSFGRATRKSSLSPVRSSRRSISPLRSSHRSISRSSGRAPSRRAASRSPVRSPRRVVSRSPVRSPRRVASRSPVRSPRRSYRRSPSRSPLPTRRRSLSRSASPDGSPKRVRRGRGFSDRYSFARKYRTPTPDRYRYGGRDRYSGYRRSPRRYRSPRRSPPRYRSRRSRSRSRSVSRSPPYRRRRYSPNPIRSRSPVDPPRYRASPLAEKRLSSSSRSRSRSRSRSPSASASGSSRGSSPPKKATLRSRSSSVSSGGKKGLVSYGDGSPESSPR